MSQLISIEGTKLPEGAKDITPKDSAIPIYIVPPTSEEIAANEQFMQEEAERLAVEEAKELAKQSAVAKLAKLGLTEDEARAIVGI